MIGCLFCFITVNGHAAVMRDLFTATVPVTNIQTKPSLPVLQQAMKQMLLKVTGRSATLQNAVILAAEQNAQQYIQSAVYQTGMMFGRVDLAVKFNQQAIEQLLHQANIAVWNSNRPLVLTWAVEQAFSADTPRGILTNDSYSQLRLLLGYYAEKRGLPIIFPVLASQYSTKVTPQDVWDGHFLRLQNFSNTYSADAMVITRIKQVSKTQWRGQWTLLVAGKQFNWVVNAPTLQALIKEGVNNLTDVLAKESLSSDRMRAQKQAMGH